MVAAQEKDNQLLCVTKTDDSTGKVEAVRATDKPVSTIIRTTFVNVNLPIRHETHSIAKFKVDW